MPDMKKMSSKKKIERFLEQNIGRVIDTEEIKQASGGVSEYARRLRELRNDEGWQILTHNDRADLKQGQYLVLSKPKHGMAPKFARPISRRLRALVLDRNGFTCQMCGVAAGDPDDLNPGRPVRLHIGHIIDKSLGGKEELSNLRALCSNCNQGAKNLTLEKPKKLWLLQQIRRAGIDEQKAILEWLQTKFQN